MTIGSPTPGPLRALLQEHIAHHDRPAAVTAALAAVESGEVEIPTLYAILGDLLVGVGDAWQHGTASVWEEHLASAAIRTIVETLYPEVRRQASARPRLGMAAVFACPQDEAHDLGLRMLSDRFDLAGWDVFWLGADTPAGEIASAAETVGAGLIVLSASTHFHRVRIRALLDGLQAELPDVRVVVGGPAFTRDCCGLEDEEVLRPEEFLGRDSGRAEV